MALQKARSFQYRPPARRKEQLPHEERKPIRLPRAGDGRSSGSNLLRLFILLAALIGLAIVMTTIR